MHLDTTQQRARARSAVLRLPSTNCSASRFLGSPRLLPLAPFPIPASRPSSSSSRLVFSFSPSHPPIDANTTALPASHVLHTFSRCYGHAEPATSDNTQSSQAIATPSAGEEYADDAVARASAGMLDDEEWSEIRRAESTESVRNKIKARKKVSEIPTSTRAITCMHAGGMAGLRACAPSRPSANRTETARSIPPSVSPRTRKAYPESTATPPPKSRTPSQRRAAGRSVNNNTDG